MLIAVLAGLSPVAPAAAVDWAQTQLVTVTTVEYAFQPNRLYLHRGAPYQLNLVNRGKQLHEFTAPAFFKALDIRNPEALNAEHTELVVRPAETKDLYFPRGRAFSAVVR